MTAAEGDPTPVPEPARAVFGDRLPLAERFTAMLVEQGVRRGLIGPREVDRIWERHLLNSAVLAELLTPESRVVDVGSGAGLPGIPLAIARPDVELVLLEPMARRVAWLQEVVEELDLGVEVVRGRAEEAAVRDPLTGLVNRLGLERRAPELLETTAARGRVPWLVLLDVDWFKDVNDLAGHAAGDAALQEVAHLLRRECRSGDLVCRWAGDEFVVLLVDESEDSRDAGLVVAERIRAAVDEHDWRVVIGRTRQPPTVSIGVAGGPAELDQLFAAADIALYRAKRAGRNRVEVDHVDPDRQPPRIT